MSPQRKRRKFRQWCYFTSIESDSPPLHRAVARGDVEALRLILSDAEVDVDAVSEGSGHTALHFASERGFLSIIALLLDAGASPRCRNSVGYTALHMAASGGSAGAVALLVQRGADVHDLSQRGTPFHVACSSGCLEAAAELLDRGSDVNAKIEDNNGGGTALHKVAMFGGKEIANLLLSRNVDISALDIKGRSALHCAWQFQNHVVAELLLTAPEAFTLACGRAGASEVHQAIREDRVKLLLNCEADVDRRDYLGMTALHWACRGHSPEVAECLLKNGANINAAVICEDDSCYFRGYTPLHFAVDNQNWKEEESQINLVELLLRWNVNVNERDNMSMTAFHRACCGKSSKIAECLLKGGAIINTAVLTNGNNSRFLGFTPLHFAVDNKNWSEEESQIDLVDLLLRWGSDVNARDDIGMTAFHRACCGKSSKIAECLLKGGANINLAVIANGNNSCFPGFTPLHFAVDNKNWGKEVSQIDLVEILLRWSVDVEARDDSGLTALHWVCRDKLLKVAECLLKGGANVNAAVFGSGNYGRFLGFTPLHFAVDDKNWRKEECNIQIDLLELLMQWKVKVDARDVLGLTALHLACRGKSPRVAECLLKGGANINAAVFSDDDSCRYLGCTPLHFAVDDENFMKEESQIDLVELLLRWSADVEARDDSGLTALHRACRGKLLKVAKCLLKAGDNINAAVFGDDDSNYVGYTPLHFAVDTHCWGGEDNQIDLVQLLLGCRADVNARDGMGMTPLHISCRLKSPKVSECLLKGGADINASVLNDTNTLLRCTSLHFAIDKENWKEEDSQNQIDLVELLLLWGADVNAKESKGLTPLTGLLQVFFDRDHAQAIANLFAKQVAMMQALNLIVDAENLQALSDHAPSRDFAAASRTEIGSLMQRRVGDSSVTFWDFLAKGTVRLADYVANDSILDVFASFDFEREFPIFAVNLRMQFDLGSERFELLRKCDSVLNASGLRWLPHACMRLLQRYLTNDDLQRISQSKAATEPQ